MRKYSYALGALFLWLSDATFANTWTDPDTKIEWTYTISDDKAIVGGGNSESGRAVPSSTTGAIVIPSSLGGYPVGNIASYAFSGCSNLVSVAIPSNVTSIGQLTFQDCPKLTYLVFEGMPPSILSGIGTTDSVGVLYPFEYKTKWREALNYWQSAYEMLLDGNFFAVGDWQNNESSRGYLWRSFANKDYATPITWRQTDTSIPCFSATLSGESTSIIEFKTIRDGMFQALLGASASSDWYSSVKLYIDGSLVRTVRTDADWLIAENFTDGREHLIRCVLSHPGCEDDAPISGGHLTYVVGSQNPIQVSFDSAGGTPVTQTVWRVKNFTMQALNDIQDPVRTGYRFRGWYTDISSGTEVTADTSTWHDDALVFYAHWQAETMRVCYDAAGGYFDFSATYRPTTYDRYPNYDTAIPSVKDPEREGYQFVGWYTAADGGTLVETNTLVQSYMHLYAHWNANPFHISYVDTRNAENPNPTAYTADDHIVFIALTNIVDGQSFDRWEPSEIAVGTTGDVKVVAHWRLADGGPYTEIVDGIEWKYRVKNGMVSVGYGPSGAIDESTSGDITIPSTLGGLAVTGITARAFRQCQNITSIAIPEGVTTIGASAFYNCTGLQKIIFPSGIESVAQTAYSGCGNLTTAVVSSGLAVTNVLGSSNITTIELVDGSTTLNTSVFVGCNSIQKVVLPASLVRIDDYAFTDCWSLTELWFNGNAPDCGENAFDGISSADFYVTDENATGWDLEDGLWHSHNLMIGQDIEKLFVSAGFSIPDMVVGDENYYKLVNNHDIAELGNWTDNEVLSGLSGRLWFDQYDQGEEFLYELSYEGAGSDVVYYWPAGRYHVTYTGTGRYTGKVSYDFTISKASQSMQGYGPSLNDNYYTTTYEGTLRTDSSACLRGYFYAPSSSYYYGTPSYSVDFNGNSYYNWYYDTPPFTVTDESSLWNNGEYRWVFDFHHAGCYAVNVNVPSTYREDDWCSYSTDSWSGSYYFTIHPAAMEQYVDVSFPDDVLEYNGQEHVVSNSMFVVRIDGGVVEQGEYFHLGFDGSYWQDCWCEEVVASTNIGVRAGTHTVAVVGLGDYSGVQYVDVVVNPRSIQNCIVSVDGSKRIYDGEAKTAAVTVVDNGISSNAVTLVEGVDYTVTFSDNVLPGDATVRVDGMGNYTNATFATFKIDPASFVLEELPNADSGFWGYCGEYDGNGHRIAPHVLVPSEYVARYAMQAEGPYVDGLLLTNACDTVQWCTLSAVGYTAVTGCARIVIARRDISNATVVAENVVRGVLEAPELRVLVVDDYAAGTLVEGRDYSIETRNDTNAGLTTIDITGMGNYCGVKTVVVSYPIRTETVDGVVWHYKDRDDHVEICYCAESDFDSMFGMVKVPDVIRGKPVTHIAECAFFGCSKLTGVSFGTNVCCIGGSAFAGCTNITDLVFAGETPMSEEDVFGDTSVQPRIWIGDLWGDDSYFGRDIVECPAVSANPSTGVQSGRTSIKLSYASVDGVTLLRYTKDGSDPTVESSQYGQKFSVTVNGLTTVKAAVFVQGVRIGKVYVFQYAPTLTEIFDANELLTLATSAPITYDTGSRSWQIDSADMGFDGTPSMRSCENIRDDEESWLGASFSGAGVFEFSWMSSCEWDDEANGEEPIFDHGYCTLDGDVVAWIDGGTSWTKVVVEVLTGGNHEIRWVYDKDGSDDDEYGYENCIRVDCVKFTYPITVSFVGGGAQGTPPEPIVSAPGYGFILPPPDGLQLQKHGFAGWKYGEKVYDAGEKVISAPADMVFEAVWCEKRLSAPIITVAAEYDEESTKVVLSSAENASIYYAVDGSDPTSESTKYVGPFAVVGSATINAVAIDPDWYDSPVASAETQRSWTLLEDCLGADGFALATGGDRNWIGDAEAGCVKSVELAEGETSWFTATCEGVGVAEWLYRSPTNDWTLCSVVFSEGGTHVLHWEGSGCMVRALTLKEAAWASFASADPVSGSLPDPICSTAGYGIALPDAAGFSRAKYTFDGWSDGVNRYSPGESYVMTGDVAFVPVWTPNLLVQPEIVVDSWYDAEKTAVKILSSDRDVTVYYTLDGSLPSRASLVYTGEFEVAGSYSIKALATKEECFDSSVVEATTVRAPWTINECLGNANLVFATGGDSDWSRCSGASEDGYCMRSGALGDGQVNWIETTVVGEGDLTFEGKVSSEETYRGQPYDYLSCSVDGCVRFWIAGEIAWTNVTLHIPGAGSHVVRWSYQKDPWPDTAAGEDCVWIDSISWTPTAAPADPIPDLGDSPTAEQVAAALAGSADAALTAHIVDGASYNAYRAWAETVKGADGQAAGTLAVKASQTAWLSFALGCETLLADAPEALTVEAFEPTAEGGRFVFTVDVKDVTVGSAATVENLKQVFGVEGGASLEKLSAENVNLTFGTPENGKVKFTAGPKDPTLPAFFMKVKLTL